MKKNMLGKTGLEVSRLGIGLSEIGFNFTSNDFSTAEKVINVALDADINFLDTAACYGISEETIGSAVSHRRSDYVLATKAGHYLPRGEGEDWTYELITKSKNAIAVSLGDRVLRSDTAITVSLFYIQELLAK